MRRKLFRSQDEGATAVEYALMVAFLAAIVAVALPAMTGPLGELFSFAVTTLQHAVDQDNP